jgi:hypothetical protein
MSIQVNLSPGKIKEMTDIANQSLACLELELGRQVDGFTPQSESKGNKRKSLTCPNNVLRTFFDGVLGSEIQKKTVFHFCDFLHHMVKIELASGNGYSHPSKAFIEDYCGQSFYKKYFCKLFFPIIRGYKLDENKKQFSVYSIYSFTKICYKFVNKNYSGEDHKKLMAMFEVTFLKNLHDYFVQDAEIPTTRIIDKQEAQANGSIADSIPSGDSGMESGGKISPKMSIPSTKTSNGINLYELRIAYDLKKEQDKELIRIRDKSKNEEMQKLLEIEYSEMMEAMEASYIQNMSNKTSQETNPY